jgi:hypothetical protein
MEQLVKLLRMLPPAPEKWVRAAQGIPLTRSQSLAHLQPGSVVVSDDNETVRGFGVEDAHRQQPW